MVPGLKLPVTVNRLILIFGYIVSNISMCLESVLIVAPSTSLEQCTTISLFVCSLSLEGTKYKQREQQRNLVYLASEITNKQELVFSVVGRQNEHLMEPDVVCQG